MACPRGDAGEQLVGRLVLERLDLRDARQRGVVAAVEHVELRELAQDLAQCGLVFDLVLREHAFKVAAHLPGERFELGIVADNVLDPAVKLVAEAREVCRLVDALLALGGSAAGEQEREEQHE